MDALINFPIPMDDTERVAFVFSENASQEVTERNVSMDDFLEWRDESRSFDYLVAV